MQTKEGKVVRWFTQRGFGIFEAIENYQIERFWAHTSSVKICVPDEIAEGCHVKFDVDDTLKLAQGRLPVAINVEVYPPTSAVPAKPVETALAEKKGEGVQQ
jgi:hypothetical protein